MGRMIKSLEQSRGVRKTRPRVASELVEEGGTWEGQQTAVANRAYHWRLLDRPQFVKLNHKIGQALHAPRNIASSPVCYFRVNAR